MRRALVAISLITAGGLSIGAAALQQPQKLPPVRDIQKVRDNLYFISGGDTYDRATWTGGNTAVLVTAKGVVVVDTMLPGAGPSLLARIKSVTDKPVITIINTHTHFDHSGSNTEFPATVEFVAHEGTRRQYGAGEMRASDQLRRLQGRQRQVPAEAHLQGPADVVQRRRPGRPLLLRPRPHERRLVRGVSGRARHARRRHVPPRAHAVHRLREQRRRRGRVQRHAQEGGLDDQERRDGDRRPYARRR